MMKGEINILDVLNDHGKHITMKGSMPFIVCPFHNDHDPSMAIYEDTNSAYCFVCGQSTNAEYLAATLSGTTVAEIRKKYYGENYEFRVLDTEVKEIQDSSVQTMLDVLARTIREKIKSSPSFINVAPKLLSKIVRSDLTFLKYNDYIKEIRTFEEK